MEKHECHGYLKEVEGSPLNEVFYREPRRYKYYRVYICTLCNTYWGCQSTFERGEPEGKPTYDNDWHEFGAEAPTARHV